MIFRAVHTPSSNLKTILDVLQPEPEPITALFTAAGDTGSGGLHRGLVRWDNNGSIPQLVRNCITFQLVKHFP